MSGTTATEMSAEDYRALTRQAKPSKYRNVRVQEDGYTFDSKAEHRRYCELRLLASHDEISDLRVHPRFEMFVNGMKICTYVADFSYYDRLHRRRIVEDVKGARTAVYRMKKRLMKALLAIDVEEIEVER